jgi:protein-tyrosine phosphatase
VVKLRDEIGIGVVVDLRSTAERRADGRGRLGETPIVAHHVPLFDGDAVRSQAAAAPVTLADRYVLLADFARQRIGQVLTTLAEASAPAVYHCAAGKDRTGVVTGVLLGVLGVPDEVIVADYVATQENLPAIVDRLLSTEGYQTMLAALPPDTLHAEAETMQGFLDRLRAQHGSMQDYALAAGVSAATLDRLAARLLTDLA